MARSILAKSRSKLNLSRRQTELFQKIIIVGSHMAEALRSLNQEPIPPDDVSALVAQWGNLMVQLAKMLL